MRRHALCLGALALALFVSIPTPSSAQVIYEPVRYQYGGQNPFYYGGADPYVFRYANQPSCGISSFGRVNGYAFVSGNIRTHREVENEPVRVFSDCVPYRNAAVYGFTIGDARDEAHAALPRYFRKGDLLAGAVVDDDGTVVVPARSPRVGHGHGSIEVKPYLRNNRPTTLPRPLMIIPKDALKQREAPALKVASAR
ncbi:MAG: hypothetical protein ACREIT_02420 [Tepidisphaeraceae bacterium]